MTYFKVLPEFDNTRRTDNSILVQNELYTKNELEKYNIDFEKVVEVNIPKNKTYWFFWLPIRYRLSKYLIKYNFYHLFIVRLYNINIAV